MKIGILGGSFDPPHLGHLFISQQVKEILNLDEIWLMPLYKHAFNKYQNSPSVRFKMAKCLQSSYVRISDIEMKTKKTNYTIDTLKLLSSKYPETIFYWIFGSDQLQDFHKYKEWEQLIEKYNIIIFPRGLSASNLISKVKKTLSLKIIPNNIYVLENTDLFLTNISSSKIRTLIKNKRSIKYFVPESIEKFIIENDIYS